MASNNNSLLWRPLQTSLASSTSLTGHQMMRDSSTDFQWFSSDYGMQQQQHAPSSILSSLYDHHTDDNSLYDDMLVSKDFEDEELAEIDMESFCREDMHNLLLNRRRNSSSTCALVTSSIYRPETLFSPVPDHHQQVHLSQDSLDMSGYPNEADIIQTCKANKNNYTIAFEGSIICSEASFYAGIDCLDSALDQRKRDLLEDLERRKAALKMSTSVDYNLTTWSKLKKTHNSSNLNRFLTQPPQLNPMRRQRQCWEEKRSSMGSSGNVSIMNQNNNNSETVHPIPLWLLNCTLRRTKSLSSVAIGEAGGDNNNTTNTPRKRGSKLNVSQVIMDNMDQGSSSSASPSYEQHKLRSLLPNCAIPIHHSQHQLLAMQQQKSEPDSASSTTSNNNAPNNNVQPNISNSGGGSGDRPPSFNLVKLFIKQKSSSTDTCMDVSSGLWPSDSPQSMSFEQQQSQQTATTINVNIQNRNYFKRRLEGSGLDRTEEENDVDSLDPLLNNNNAGGGGVGKIEAVAGVIKNHAVMESNNNLINNLINNNHCTEDTTTTVTSDDQQITQIYNNIRNNNGEAQIQPKNTKNLRRMQQMQHQETCTRSMQTSIPKLITSATQYASKAADAAARSGSANTEGSCCMSLSQRVKIVPTSFLKQLHTNERRGEGGIAPVYVIYPNYTLPNLDFVRKHDVILSPIDYKETFMGMNAVKMGAISKLRSKEAANGTAMSTPAVNTAKVCTPPGRPKSFCDILGGKQRTKFDYKNICDWKSLIVLLPIEYSRILRSIPDIEKELEGLHEDTDDGFGEDDVHQQSSSSQGEMNTSQRQMYCQTTPVMRRRAARPLSCDCTAYIMQTSSSSSSSNQPASSGYRGSSTLLTDSEFGVVGIENELSDDTTGLPPTHCGRTPKGILRRNFNRSRMKLQQGKRNSMFDGTGEKVVNDKRRSLQEFPTQQYFDNIQMAELQEQLAAEQEMNDAPPTTATALSPLLNYKQQGGHSSGSGNDLSGLNRFRNKLSSELEALELELEEDNNSPCQNTSYDRVKLRNDVSRALCNHPKRVSFSEGSTSEGDSTATVVGGAGQSAKGGLLLAPQLLNDFSTPPNSPNVSLVAQQKRQKAAQQSEQERIQNNRFKRLQIQWELMSKDSESLLEEMNEIIPVKMETKSGGSTPTGPQRISRIPRPISYPAASSRIQETATSKLPGGRTPLNRTGTSKKVQSPTTAVNSPRVQSGVSSKVGQQMKKTNVTTNRFVPKTVR